MSLVGAPFFGSARTQVLHMVFFIYKLVQNTWIISLPKEFVVFECTLQESVLPNKYLCKQKEKKKSENEVYVIDSK